MAARHDAVPPSPTRRPKIERRARTRDRLALGEATFGFLPAGASDSSPPTGFAAGATSSLVPTTPGTAKGPPIADVELPPAVNTFAPIVRPPFTASWVSIGRTDKLLAGVVRRRSATLPEVSSRRAGRGPRNEKSEVVHGTKAVRASLATPGSAADARGAREARARSVAIVGSGYGAAVAGLRLTEAGVPRTLCEIATLAERNVARIIAEDFRARAA
jgi:hypothetical protein